MVESSKTPGARVLIVDDDPVFTAMAEECLSDAGYGIRVATDGVEALDILETDPFDLALIDLSMPRIDGFRLIGLIRGAHRWRAMAIVVVSARHDAHAFDEAIAMGAVGYQTKPIDWLKFPEQIENFLQKPARA